MVNWFSCRCYIPVCMPDCLGWVVSSQVVACPWSKSSSKELYSHKDEKAHHNVYGCLSLKVTRMVPRVGCEAAFATGALFSYSETPSISFPGTNTSSTSPPSLSESYFFRLMRVVLEEPWRRKGAADLKKPRSSSWLLRIFRSWSVMPFPT